MSIRSALTLAALPALLLACGGEQAVTAPPETAAPSEPERPPLATTDPVGTPDFEVAPEAAQPTTAPSAPAASLPAEAPAPAPVAAPTYPPTPGSTGQLGLPTTDPVGTPDFQVDPRLLQQPEGDQAAPDEIDEKEAANAPAVP